MRYVHLPGAAVDTALLEDATRRGEPPLLDEPKNVTADYCYDLQKQHSKYQNPDDTHKRCQEDSKIMNEGVSTIQQFEAGWKGWVRS